MADGTYWAARETREMLAEAFRRIDKWFEHVQTSGKLTTWRHALDEYYAGARTGGEVGTAGAQGELTTIKVNHYHSFGEHIVTAIAGQPPTFLPQAQSNDHESTSQTVVTNAILESVVTQRGLDEVFTTSTRRAYVITEGWAAPEWDENAGEEYAQDPTTGRVVRKGDVRVRTYAPIDVVRDYTKETAQDHEWYILRRFENRYNVIARAKAKAPDEKTASAWEAAILGVPSKIDEQTNRPRLIDATRSVDESDDIAVWELRHARTDACPDGKRTVFVNPDVVLLDGPLGFKDVFVFAMRPEEEIGRESGYSQGLDLLAPQHAINAAYSSVMSALASLGHAVVHSDSPNITTEELQAFTLMKGPGKVQAINLLPPDATKGHYEFAEKMKADAEIISGVNAVRRGNLEATGKLSGAAYALIDAKFLESVVGLQRSFKSFASALATAIVQLYQQFATAEQTVKVTGKANRVYAKSFTGQTIGKVLRVDIEMGDPLSRTASGRLQLAEMLLKVPDANGKPIIKTPEQLIEVVKTGRLEPLTQGQSKELDNIRAENEMLGDGQTPQVFIFDNHPQHIQEHYSVVASPESRADGSPVVGATLQHISEHLAQWQQAPLDGLAARGIPPPPPPAPMVSMAPPSAPGPTSGTPPPSSGPPSITGDAAPAPEGAGPQPNMPNMPTNPQTGEPAPAPPMV